MRGERKEANRMRGKEKNGSNVSANNGQLKSPTPNPSQQRTLASAVDSPHSLPPPKSLTLPGQLFNCCSKSDYIVAKPLKWFMHISANNWECLDLIRGKYNQGSENW